MSFADALWIAFAIPDYDSVIHAPKIYNLLSRIKDLLPRGASLKTKGGFIYLECEAHAIIRIQALPHEEKLVDDISEIQFVSESQAKRTFERPLHPRAIVQRTGGKRSHSREELQSLMKTSKANTVRILQQWMERGLVRREGVGRSTVYHIDIINDSRLA